tara:strand:- start:331 stop:783 length:453 start_codon:yes stop_codon:yes gene_type:complete
MEKIKLLLLLLLISLIVPIKEDDYSIPSGEEYIIGEDGIRRIYVNVWGHVNKPGTYLVYEDIDISTLLSVAGGPLNGADLSEIEIISKKDGKVENIDLYEILSSSNIREISFSPYDTIRIEPTFRFYLRQNAYLMNVFVQLLTLGITLNN